MRQLDLQVIGSALEWMKAEHTVWLSTVLKTFGSSPREPGSMLVARADGTHQGSLSGGCVEEDFLARIQGNEFCTPVCTLRYGDDAEPSAGVRLPCGGILEVLVERLLPTRENLAHMEAMDAALRGQVSKLRLISLPSGDISLSDAHAQGPQVLTDTDRVQILIGPVLRLIIAGISPVSQACAEFALALGFEVIVCDPREEVCDGFSVEGARVEAVLPSLFIAAANCHSATAIVALTHDPRIDDLAMIDAVRTPAFYIGVMGSSRTSRTRAERLQRSGGLTRDDVERLHMPIGLNLGSKTPAEIALAVMADILRVYRGKTRLEL